jgi:hypothetical protein
MEPICGNLVNKKMAIVMAGISKVFVGEIIETGNNSSYQYSNIV